MALSEQRYWTHHDIHSTRRAHAADARAAARARIADRPDHRRAVLARLAASVASGLAVEHGPFWEVGLLCGIIYNWWMRRTRSLGDLMLVHAVTNLALAVYVIVTGRWMFWM